MEKNEVNKPLIEEYIKRLIDLDNRLSGINEEDTEEQNEFVDELTNVLTSLGEDVQNNLNPKDDGSLKIKIKKLREDAIVPTYAKPGDAGMDLTITEIKSQLSGVDITYGFGIAIEIPVGYVGLIFPRSSIRNKKIILSNCVGVVDSGFRGEIEATFLTNHPTAKIYAIGERAAQIIILPFPRVKFVESDELSDSERNLGGFGSSGI